MKYYLGIDGGGTKTAVTVIDEFNNIVYVGSSGASSLDTVSHVETKCSIEKALEKFEHKSEIVSCFGAFGGVCGLETKRNAIQIISSIEYLKNAKIVCDNDIVAAILAGKGKLEGMAVIAGTGSVAYGVHNGKSHRTSGFSYMEGDYGSAYDLGIHALKHAAKVYDKRQDKSILSDMIFEVYGVIEFSDMVKLFESGRTNIAGVARLVTKAESMGCKTAKKIIESSVEEMFLMIKTVYNELEFKETTLAITGSVGNLDTHYRRYLIKLLNEKLPGITLIKNMYSADHAAALYAKEI